MKANELRIGNYLQYYIGEDGYEWQPSGIDHHDIVWCVEDNDDFNKSYRPIPITEEWLLKFGFEKITAWYRKWLHAINLMINVGHGQTIAGLYEFKNIPIKQVSYVHELQNLYFALTGEELEAK